MFYLRPQSLIQTHSDSNLEEIKQRFQQVNVALSFNNHFKIHGVNLAGTHLYKKQIDHNHSSPADPSGTIESRKGMNYGYIEYLHKAMANRTDASENVEDFHMIKMHESFRDYYSISLWPINHLIQLDEKPNFELKEPRWEIYKISLSFELKRKLNTNSRCIIQVK